MRTALSKRQSAFLFCLDIVSAPVHQSGNDLFSIGGTADNVHRRRNAYTFGRIRHRNVRKGSDGLKAACVQVREKAHRGKAAVSVDLLTAFCQGHVKYARSKASHRRSGKFRIIYRVKLRCDSHSLISFQKSFRDKVCPVEQDNKHIKIIVVKINKKVKQIICSFCIFMIIRKINEKKLHNTG